MPEPETGHSYGFGAYRVDAQERQLWRDGERVSLPPRAFDLLLVLIKRQGHIVTKEDLMRLLWPDAFVEEANLTVNIAALRKVLGKNRDGSDFIETVPKYGYRFVASVVVLPAELPVVALPREGTPGRCRTDTPPESRFSPPLRVHAPTSLEPGAISATVPSASASPSGRAGSREWRQRTPILAVFSGVILTAAIFGVSRWINISKQAVDAPIASIAVLPLENGAPDPGADYLSDGITESLINRLMLLSGLSVASRNASFRYKGKEQDAHQIGLELNVSAVLTGSVKQIGDQLIIALSLDDVRSDQHIWGQQYVRRNTDILSVQDEIARDVTSNLRVKLTGADQQKLDKKYTQNTEAYQLYIKGNYEWNKHTREAIAKSIEYYEQARALDPNYALAYAGLSACYGVLGNDYTRPNESFPKSEAYAAKALLLDDSLGEAHNAMGAVRLYYDRNWTEAERELRNALALEPNNAGAENVYADYLDAMSRHEEAEAERKRAKALDPLSPMLSTNLGATLYYAGRYDEAIQQITESIKLEPRYAESYLYLAEAYEQKRMYTEAIKTLQQGLARAEAHPKLIATLAHIYAVAGKRSEAQKGLDQLLLPSKQQYVSPYWVAVVYAGLGNKDQAFVWLNKACDDHALFLIWLRVEPLFTPLRDDQRFNDLVQRVGFPESHFIKSPWSPQNTLR